MALLLNIDGSQETVEPKKPPYFTLRELQVLVGGLIEVVYLPDGKLLILNEEGKLDGLAYNEQATLRASECLWPGDYIAGIAVVVSMQEMEGD